MRKFSWVLLVLLVLLVFSVYAEDEKLLVVESVDYPQTLYLSTAAPASEPSLFLNKTLIFF